MALVCVVVGLLPRAAAGPIEIANAAPPVIAGLVIAAALEPSTAAAALAIALVGWAPLAAHTSALVTEVETQAHIRILPVLGVGPARIMFTSVLPAVIGPVTRHGLLRLPGIALSLAALGFLGLGPQPPAPDWGLLLSEGLAYVERGPWVVIAPMGALIVLAVLAVSLSSLSVSPRMRRSSRGHNDSIGQQHRAMPDENSATVDSFTPDSP